MRQSWQRTRRQQRKRKRNFTLRLAAIVPGQARPDQARGEGYAITPAYAAYGWFFSIVCCVATPERSPCLLCDFLTDCVYPSPNPSLRPSRRADATLLINWLATLRLHSCGIKDPAEPGAGFLKINSLRVFIFTFRNSFPPGLGVRQPKVQQRDWSVSVCVCVWARIEQLRGNTMIYYGVYSAGPAGKKHVCYMSNWKYAQHAEQASLEEIFRDFWHL